MELVASSLVELGLELHPETHTHTHTLHYFTTQTHTHFTLLYHTDTHTHTLYITIPHRQTHTLHTQTHTHFTLLARCIYQNYSHTFQLLYNNSKCAEFLTKSVTSYNIQFHVIISLNPKLYFCTLCNTCFTYIIRYAGVLPRVHRPKIFMAS
jgi:hypothetical protein